jgi:hypothetical protein
MDSQLYKYGLGNSWRGKPLERQVALATGLPTLGVSPT